MAEQVTLKRLLHHAIEKEIEAQHLYADLGKRMTDQAARDACDELYRQEVGHQKLLERYASGGFKVGALSPRRTIDYKIAERFAKPEVTSDMQLKDVFLLAANREKVSHELYRSLADSHPAGEVKDLFEGLAADELRHKQKVEFIYTEVAFPQTDGG